MNRFKKICAAFESSINVMIVAVAVVMVVIGVLQILFRYVFSASLSWSEESIRYLHVWVTTIGAAACFYSGSFTVITVISDKIEAHSKIAGRALMVIRYIIPYLFYGILLVEGWQICSVYMMKMAASTRIPMGIVYACIPLTGLFGLVFSVARFPDFLNKLKGRAEE